MAIHKVALLLVFGMILLASNFEHADAKECDPRIDFGICPYLGTKKVDGICINCCSGYKECKYFSKDYTFICDGESDSWESRKACTKECDRRIDIGICATDLTKTVNGLCTTCSAGKKGCKYFNNNGTYICDGESEWLSEGENDLQKSNVAIS
ncbi:proteinase inhibitor type-2 TR8-like [Solanum stenotomum]|uniref:proteinase inhibitor type-2 TR8-like n=1 Tax=Solanum stenotomum TaxID=172797 RepID=UPI0020D02D6C|nr:proteinase inhibitor type-2 TR8-like [Solanum stenotomum]